MRLYICARFRGEKWRLNACCDNACEPLGSLLLTSASGVRVKSEQEVFDETYITSVEVCQRLDINRATIVTARQRGKLPEAIVIPRPGGQPYLLLWPRKVVEPILSEWQTELDAWRAARA